MKIILIIILMSFSVQSFAQDSPVIIELFTSQGCSSCPAADRNLSELLLKSAAEGQPVIGLSFHVDYWNYIGWKDPYSSKAYTERQKNYANVMNLPSIYTPQMIVNGEYEFVGSNKSEAVHYIKKAKTSPPRFTIEATHQLTNDNLLTITYAVEGVPSNDVLNVALIDRQVENEVPRGENRGRKLRHANVVRTFKTVPLHKQGSIQLEVAPSGPEGSFLVFYIQDKQLRVVSALMKPL